MRSYKARRVGMMVTASGLFLGAALSPSFGGDEPGRFGRLFRGGGASRPNDAPPVGKPSTAPPSYGEAVGRTATPQPVPSSFGTPSLSAMPNPGSGSRIVAQPRVSQSATESDPLVTRVSIGRADDGKQFCMFIQVFADGTVLDSEGVHKVGADSLRPIAQVIASGELAKLKGHCGGPSSDFIEQVHTVVYDRYLGRLRANNFSHSGNTQGCDASVQELNSAIDALQAKLAGPAQVAPTATSPLPLPGPRTIGLTHGS